MKLTLSTNVEQYRAMVVAGAAARLEADRRAAVALTGDFVGFIAENGPHDTNRFVRSFVEAGEQVGVRGIRKPEIRASSRYERYLKALVRQAQGYDLELKRWEGRARFWYQNKGRTREPYYRKVEREIAQIRQRRKRAFEELEKAKGNQAIIFMDEHGDIHGLNASGKSRAVSTVRVKVYGGRGSRSVVNGQVVVILHSLEPHANFVNKRFGVVARAKAHVYSAGLRNLRGPYAAKIRGAMRLDR